MRGFIRHILCWLLVLVGLSTNAKNFYSTCNNGFYGFINCHIESNKMLVPNEADSTRFLLHSELVSPYHFKVVARLANKHNQEDKAYPIISNNGKHAKVKNTKWGIVLNFISPSDYCAAVLHCKNSAPHDLLDKRTMICDLVKTTNGVESTLATTELSSNVNLFTGDNLVSIECKDNHITVQLGEKRLIDVLSGSVAVSEKSSTGVYAGPGAEVAIERYILKQYSNPIEPVLTNWSRDRIDAYLKSSTDAFEGYWAYLDRDIDDSKVKLGGRYIVALIATDDGYDILYIDGAQVLSDKWQTGYLKGQLKKTVFQDHYDLIWYDSSFKPFKVESSAVIENGSVMTLYFPLQKSQIRFYKTKK